MNEQTKKCANETCNCSVCRCDASESPAETSCKCGPECRCGASCGCGNAAK